MTAASAQFGAHLTSAGYRKNLAEEIRGRSRHINLPGKK